MKSFKTSKLRVYNNNGHNYIYIFYKEDGHALKINTKFEYVTNKMTVDNLYNSKMKEHEKLNGHIQEMQWVVDSYINLVSGHRPVNQKECLEYLKENKYHASKAPISAVNKLSSISDYYDQFFEWKKTQPFIREISFKNYQSFKNFLTDLQKYKKRKYYLIDVDEDFITLMINFSQIDLRKLDGYTSHGHLQINTLKKRLDVFKEFLNWLGKKKIASFSTQILFPKIEKTSKEVVYLTIKEIQQLLAKRDKIEGDNNKVAFDSFIFNCECGLRYADLSSLSKADFTKIPEGYILKRELHKHTERFAAESQIPIVNPLLVEIIEKYDFHFDLKGDGQYNRTLHSLFKKHNLFTEPLIEKRKYIKGEEKEEVLKNDIITCHSCRRSMITNAFLEGYTDAQIMQMSGHKNLRTLQKYSNFANDELLKKNLNKKLQKIKKVRIKHKN